MARSRTKKRDSQVMASVKYKLGWDYPSGRYFLVEEWGGMPCWITDDECDVLKSTGKFPSRFEIVE